MDAEAKRAREEMKKLPFKKKLENFWFYYRIHVIVALVMVLVFGTSVVQCIRRVDYDLTVSYYGCEQVDTGVMLELEKFLDENCEDINGNGSVDTVLNTYVGDVTLEVQSPETMGILVKIQAEIVGGTCAAFIVDEEYKEFITQGYEGAIDKVYDLSAVPELGERIKTADGGKLYWLSVVESADSKAASDDPDQFDAADKLEKRLENAECKITPSVKPSV